MKSTLARAALAVIIAVGGVGLAACQSSSAPPGVDPAIVHAFETAWAGAPPGAISYMERVVIPRESGWDPCSINPSIHDCSQYAPSHAAGLLQLLNHYDLILQACPNPYAPLWQNPYCNARAGFFLSGGGHDLSPWLGPYFAAARTGPTSPYQLVVLRMPKTSRRGLGASDWWAREAGSAGAYGNEVDLWNFVVASNYAQTIIDAQAAASRNRGPAIGGATGDCFGSSVPSYIVNRESGGNPNAYNPSGAWGCFQFMPGTWSGAGCDAYGPYGSASAAAQKQCADKVWAGGAGSGNWAQTRSASSGPSSPYQLVVLKTASSSGDRYRYLTGHAMVEQEAIDRWTFVTAADYAESLIVAAEDARWARTHECEEGGQGWYAAGSTRDGTFHGGLGVSVQAWAENSSGYPSDALDASQYQQELVADRILARYGHSAWACPTPAP